MRTVILALAGASALVVTAYAAPKAVPRTQQESVLLELRTAADWEKQLQSADWLDRWQAVYALGTMGREAEGAVPVLVETLKDKDERVQAGAAASLGKIGPPAFPALQQLLRGGERRQRRWSAYALGRSGNPDAIPLLVTATADTRDDVREKAVESLKLLGYGGKDAVRLFMQGVKDPNPAVRFHSAQALGNLGDPSAVGLLTSALDDPNLNIRAAACESLGRIGPASEKAVPRLISLLSDHVFVQNFAITALGGIGTGAEAALEPLKAVAEGKGPESTRTKAKWAIEQIEKPAEDEDLPAGGSSGGKAP